MSMASAYRETLRYRGEAHIRKCSVQKIVSSRYDVSVSMRMTELNFVDPQSASSDGTTSDFDYIETINIVYAVRASNETGSQSPEHMREARSTNHAVLQKNSGGSARCTVIVRPPATHPSTGRQLRPTQASECNCAFDKYEC